MKETWNNIGEDLIGYQAMDCLYCPTNRPEKKPNRATQGAHALVYKRYYNKKGAHRNINVRENYMPCCDDCQKFSETYKGRCHAWGVLVEWYGDRVKTWYDSLNLKVKENLNE